jgi:hypothetical protein
MLVMGNASSPLILYSEPQSRHTVGVLVSSPSNKLGDSEKIASSPSYWHKSFYRRFQVQTGDPSLRFTISVNEL